MPFFYEILKTKIGFSRIGRIPCITGKRKYIRTPNLVIPINPVLFQIFDFIKEFANQEIFLISDKKYLKKSFITAKYSNATFIYTHSGLFSEFEKIISKKAKIFLNNNVIPLIPFNVPTTVINQEFAENEINAYLFKVKKLLRTFPKIKFGISLKFFDYIEPLETYISFIKDRNNIKLLNLCDVFDNLHNFRKILEIIIRFKKDLDNNLVLMASGNITVNYFPLLIYLGIDLINASYLVFLASHELYDSIEYILPFQRVSYFPCGCVACQKLKQIDKNDLNDQQIVDLLCLHNLLIANTQIDKIKQYLRYEDYRAYIEKECFNDMTMISFLRILDKKYYEILKYETPVSEKLKIVKCLGPSSFYRPDFCFFRKNAVDKFTPEQWTKMIVLLPCSATKPYSQSPSHQKFLSVLRNFPEFPTFQEFILTSPLGAIPRQLENIYSVTSYDISVTGEWSQEEIKISADMLFKFLNKYHPEIPILCHLEGGYKSIVENVGARLNRHIYFSQISEKITSNDSLSSLKRLIKTHKDDFSLEKEDPSKILTKTWSRKIIKILDYQFGTGTGLQLFPHEIKLKKDRSRTKYHILNSDRQCLAIYNIPTGMVRLTLQGAEKLMPLSHESNVVIFDGDELRGNTLFRPGILKYSSNLYPKNQVFILNKTETKVLAVGKLIVGSSFLNHSKSGRVVALDEISE